MTDQEDDRVGRWEGVSHGGREHGTPESDALIIGVSHGHSVKVLSMEKLTIYHP